MQLRGLRLLPALAALLGLPLLVPATPAQEGAVAEAPVVHAVPFAHAGGVSGAVMIIRAEVDGVDTRLLFDTGAAFPLVIDTEVAKARGMTGYYGVPVHGVGKSQIELTAVESLSIGQWRHGRLTAGIMDISHIRGAMSMLGTRIDGIVGMPVISGFRRVRLDFNRTRFELEEFGADEELPAELTAVRAEFARDLDAVAAIRAKTAGGLGVEVEVAAGGLRVTGIEPGSVASKTGLRVGALLTRIDDVPLGASPRDLRIHEALTGAGNEVKLHYSVGLDDAVAPIRLGAWKTGAPGGPKKKNGESEDF